MHAFHGGTELAIFSVIFSQPTGLTRPSPSASTTRSYGSLFALASLSIANTHMEHVVVDTPVHAG